MDSVIGIDSLTIRIPLNELDYIHESLLSSISVVCDDTLEVLDRKNTANIKDEWKGITTKFYRKNVFGEDLLYVTLQAKQLMQRYLQGINSKNIHFVYDYVMSIGRFACSRTVFLQAGIHDVDIKSDASMNENDWCENIHFRNSVVPHAKLYKHQSSPGLEYNTRSNATNSKPYLKYYSKYHELESNSHSFFKEFIIPYKNTDLRRLEVTVRNSSHWKYLVKHRVISKERLPTNLKELLNLSESDLANITRFIRNQYESNKCTPRTRKKVSRLSASDLILMRLLDYWDADTNNSHGMLLNELGQSFGGNSLKSTKYRWKKKLKKLSKQYKEIKRLDISEHRVPFKDLSEIF